MIRKIALIVGGMLVLLAITLSPAEGHTGVGCATVEFEWQGNTPVLTSIVDYDDDVRVSIVGYFLWIQYSADVSSLENQTSVDVYTLVSPATVCTDWIDTGTVVARPTIYVPQYAMELVTGSAVQYTTPFGQVLS